MNENKQTIKQTTKQTTNNNYWFQSSYLKSISQDKTETDRD